MILVTGSSGRLGTILLGQMEPNQVVGYDIKHGDDILDSDALAEAMAGCEMVVHLAAIPGPIEGPDWGDYFGANCLGTFNVAERAAMYSVKRLVFASSLAYYGYETGIPLRKPVTEESPPIPTYLKAGDLQCYDQALMYSQSKMIAENILAFYGLTKRLEVVCLRFGALGPVTTFEQAAAAIMWALTAPGPFWYEAFNVTRPEVDWVDCGKILEAGHDIR